MRWILSIFVTFLRHIPPTTCNMAVCLMRYIGHLCNHSRPYPLPPGTPWIRSHWLYRTPSILTYRQTFRWKQMCRIRSATRPFVSQSVALSRRLDHVDRSASYYHWQRPPQAEWHRGIALMSQLWRYGNRVGSNYIVPHFVAYDCRGRSYRSHKTVSLQMIRALPKSRNQEFTEAVNVGICREF